MKSIRGYLDVGSLYKLHDHDEYCFECIRRITDDHYSSYSAYVRSTISGWTMIVHGTIFMKTVRLIGIFQRMESIPINVQMVF